jgi:hypothetical protein
MLPAAAVPHADGVVPVVIAGVTEKMQLSDWGKFASPTSIQLSHPNAILILDVSGAFVVQNITGALVQLTNVGSVNIGSAAGQALTLFATGPDSVQLATEGVTVAQAFVDPSSLPAFAILSRLDLGFAVAGAIPGVQAGYFPIYDLSGTFLGNVPYFA